MTEERAQKLKSFLETGDNWEEQEEGEGIYLLKMPKNKRFEHRLALKIYPLNSEGEEIKKKGIVLTSSDMLKFYRQIINNDKLGGIITELDELNSNAKKESYDE